MLQLVIDTNVIISSLLTPHNKPAQIVSMILLEKARICLSEAIFNEYTGVLSRSKFQKLDRISVRDFLLKIKHIGEWVAPSQKIDLIEVDPNDNKFLECALEAHAHYLITGNKRHFPMASFHGTKILTPADFLLSL